MKDVAAVVAAAAGSSRGIGIKGNLVRIISMYLTADITCHVSSTHNYFSSLLNL
jgi:hypothetical protein